MKGLIVVCLGISGWSLTTSIAQGIAQARMAENIGEIDFGVIAHQLEDIAHNTDRDDAQDQRLAELRTTNRKFWRLHSAVRDSINNQRARDGHELFTWPALDTDQ